MRNVESHLLEDKMDEAVTHYINTHQQPESVHVDASTLALNVQEDGGRVVTVMHPQNFPSQMCRQVSVGEQVGEGQWEELMDPESRIAAIVAHLAQHSRTSHQTHTAYHKVSNTRGDVDASVILDTPLRMFNGQTLEQQEPIVVQVPPLPPLPPLQDMKRCEADWFNKDKNTLKDDNQILPEDSQVMDMGSAGASPAQSKQPSKKSLPHKKRISRKLKRTNGGSTPQQDIVVINCGETQEEILPDSFAPPPLPPLPHLQHDMRAMFICQLCGDYYGDEQLKFYQHLKQHYEPHATIIIENPVPDLGIDKMTNTCIVDNVSTLPDSIVELTLEGTVPKTMYQTIDKHILYTSSDKTLSYANNKVQYSVASMDKEPENEKTDLYESLEKMEIHFCNKCNKSFKKQKHYEMHIKEAHSNPKLEDMSEFSEPEDLMEGIHVAVDESGEHYEQNILPHLTIENGHVHQEHVRHWYMRNGAPAECACGGAGYCSLCEPHESPVHTHTHAHAHTHPAHIPPTHTQTQTMHQPPSPTQTIHLAPPQPAIHEAPHTIHTTQPPSPTLIHQSQAIHQTTQTSTQTIYPTNQTIQTTSHNQTDSHIQLTTHAVSHSHTLQTITQPTSPQTSLATSHGGEVSQVTHIHTHTTEPSIPNIQRQPEDPKEEALQRIFDPNSHREQKYAIESHTELHIKDEPQPEQDKKKGTRNFECIECGRVFKHRNSLLYHILMHGEKQQVCRECGKSFYTAAALKIHKRMHSDDRPCKCDECGREFRQCSDLKYHKASKHSKEKHFKCEFCEKRFARRYSLNVHRRIHTGEKNYKCDYCCKTFRASSYRLSHMRTHTGSRPFKCTECEKCFRVAYDLRRHMLIHDKSRAKNDTKNKQKNTKEDKTVKQETKKIEPNIEGNPGPPEAVDKTGSDNKLPILKGLLDKKQTRASKKSPKKAPNVTVQNRPDGQFKIYDSYDLEVFDMREPKYKETYTEDNITKLEERPEDRTNLRLLKTAQISENVETERLVFSKENTDGKLQVFTQIEKSKDYNGPIVTNAVSLSDIRNLERDVNRETRAEVQGESLENGFFERLSAYYNIPAV